MSTLLFKSTVNLAHLRIEVSQLQLAEDLGIGKQSISDYEKQKATPPLQVNE